MKILMVLTSHDALGDTGEKTGFWLEEFAAPYYAFVDAGASVRLASPQGGQPPIDPKSDAEDAQTAHTRRFRGDVLAQAALAETAPLADMDPAAFDAVFYPGGHGPLWDLATDAGSIALIARFAAAGKPTGFVCHAPAVLRDVKAPDGAPFVRGRRVTGFTNEEEAAVGLTEVVPFLIEDVFTAQGARFERGAAWAPFVVEDGSLVTGQNPASSEAAALALLRQLRAARAA